MTASAERLVDAVTADAAIRRVLEAEVAARAAVEAARADAQRRGEEARLAARAMAERSERRMRRITDAFGRDLAQRLAAIAAEADQLAAPAPPDAAERAELQRQVRELAREIVGAAP
ncbi:MAG: hypothetical protein KGN16_07370 [Burkholderiales bacterium]|nr:hypothetical protein [Burkholderiales bacterium]